MHVQLAEERTPVLAGGDKLVTDHAKTRDHAGTTPRVLGSWTRVLLDALNENGYDGRVIAEKAGFSIDEFTDSSVQFSLDRTSEFWRLAVLETGDDALGIWVSKSIKQTTFHALGLAVAASKNFHEALLRMERYCDIVSDSEKVRINILDDHWEYRLIPGAETYRASPTSLDTIMSHMIRASRASITGFHAPLSASFARSRPANYKRFADFYQCPIEYDADINVISLAKDLMDAPLTTANVVLADYGDHILDTVLESTRTDPFDERIRQSMIERLPSGDISLELVAASVGRSARSLQRHFSESGTTFTELLSEHRAELARNYLGQSELAITEIAFLLGYNGTTSFSRAFKTWTGQTPREFKVTVG